jgi:hypothetical protein
VSGGSMAFVRGFGGGFDCRAASIGIGSDCRWVGGRPGPCLCLMGPSASGAADVDRDLSSGTDVAIRPCTRPEFSRGLIHINPSDLVVFMIVNRPPTGLFSHA